MSALRELKLRLGRRSRPADPPAPRPGPRGCPQRASQPGCRARPAAGPTCAGHGLKPPPAPHVCPRRLAPPRPLGDPGAADPQPSRGRNGPTPGSRADRKARRDALCAGATCSAEHLAAARRRWGRQRLGGGEAAAPGPDHVRTTWRPLQPRTAVGSPDRPRRAASSPQRRRAGSPRRRPR